MRILLITDGTDTNFADATCVANPGICNGWHRLPGLG